MTTLSEKRNLFEVQIPEALKTSLRIKGCQTHEWRVSVVGSKSVTNRAILLAALAGQPVNLHAPLLADDTWWGFCVLETLGFELDVSALPQVIRVQGLHDTLNLTPPLSTPRMERQLASFPSGRSLSQKVTLHVGQAGTLARFIPALLLNWQRIYPNSVFNEFEVTAHEQLMRRPLRPLLDALTSLGANIPSLTTTDNQQAFLMRLHTSQLHGDSAIDGSQSGQFLSGLLLAAAGSRNSCYITRYNGLVQPDYVRITRQMLQEFGARIDTDSDLQNFHVHGQEWQPPQDYVIEADASTACYYAALACVFGIDLHVDNLGSSTLQPDFEFIQILNQFGYSVSAQEKNFSVFGSYPKQTPASFLRLDMSRCSDQSLTVGVMSIVSGIAVEVFGVAHIRHHESDRIAAFCRNCRNLGISVEEYDDGFRVTPHLQKHELNGPWPTHADHRFALSGLVLSAWAPGVSLLEPGCLKKTAPGFVSHLQSLGVLFER